MSLFQKNKNLQKNLLGMPCTGQNTGKIQFKEFRILHDKIVDLYIFLSFIKKSHCLRSYVHIKDHDRNSNVGSENHKKSSVKKLRLILTHFKVKLTAPCCLYSEV